MDKTGHLYADGLKPALMAIQTACKYMGGVSRAKLYADLLPHLDTVHIGSRHFVVVKSMDRLIAKLLGKDAAVANTRAASPKLRSVGNEL
jgi:hypothetical protein